MTLIRETNKMNLTIWTKLFVSNQT